MDVTTKTPRVGELRIGDATEYEGHTGFVVEQFTYGNQHEPDWAVPGWFEDCWGEDGFFATEAEAKAFIEMVSA